MEKTTSTPRSARRPRMRTRVSRKRAAVVVLCIVGGAGAVVAGFVGAGLVVAGAGALLVILGEAAATKTIVREPAGPVDRGTD